MTAASISASSPVSASAPAPSPAYATSKACAPTHAPTPCSANNAAPPTAPTFGALAALGPCPAFNVKLTKEQLQPFVLQALQLIKPSSCSALDLSKKLWPEKTALRSSMKTTVRWLDLLASLVTHRIHCQGACNASWSCIGQSTPTLHLMCWKACSTTCEQRHMHTACRSLRCSPKGAALT